MVMKNFIYGLFLGQHKACATHHQDKYIQKISPLGRAILVVEKWPKMQLVYFDH